MISNFDFYIELTLNRSNQLRKISWFEKLYYSCLLICRKKVRLVTF